MDREGKYLVRVEMRLFEDNSMIHAGSGEEKFERRRNIQG